MSLGVIFISLAVVVLNLVGGCQALGTPAVDRPDDAAGRGRALLDLARRADVSRDRRRSCISGLLLSYRASLPSGPAIILSSGVVYILPILAGTRGVLATRVRHASHRTA